MAKIYSVLIPLFLLLLLIPACNAGPMPAKNEKPSPIKPVSATREPELTGTGVSIKDSAPSNITPGDSDIKIAQVAIWSDQAHIAWTGLKIDLVGDLQDNDIRNVKIYLDNGNGTFEPKRDTLIGQGTFSSNQADLRLREQLLEKKPRTCFITLDLDSNIKPGLSFGIRISNEMYFRINDPLGVVSNEIPFASNLALINKNSSVSHSDNTPALTRDTQIMLDTAEKDKTVKMQENDFLSQKYYEAGFKLFQEFKFNEAQDSLEKALQINPEHQAARKLLQEIKLISGSRAEEIQTVKDFMEDRLSTKIQETEMEVRNHLLKGERYLSEKQFKQALDEFEQVELKLKWLPYDIGLNEYRARAQQNTKIAQDLLSKNEQDQDTQHKIAAALIAKEEDTRRQQEYSERVKTLFKEGLLNFEQERYEEAERLADKILTMLPEFAPAIQLKEESQKVRHRSAKASYLAQRLENWKQLMDDMQETLIPYAEPVRYDRDTWDKALVRKPPLLGEEEANDPDTLEIKNKLESIRHDFVLDGSNTLYEVMDLLNQRYNIMVQYSSAVKSENIPAEKKYLSLTGLPLKEGLKQLFKLYNLTYVVKDKSIYIVKATETIEELVPRIHDVNDLLRPVQDFPGPNIDLSRQGGPAAGGVETDVPKPTLAVDDLIKLIQNNVARNTWETQPNAIPGVSLKRMGQSNRLVVIHTVQVQKEVTEFLKALRTFAGSMIVVDTRFLGVTDDFLEDVGVQFNQGTFKSPGLSDTSSPGRDRSWDWSASTAYSFLNGKGQMPFAMGGRLQDRGGLGFQYSMLNDLQVNLIARALQKQAKGVLLDAPRVMAMNGQRVHVAFLRQQNYIKDLEVIASQAAIAFEPVIDTFTTGVVLDVKPVMSYDRKYVTMHLVPTLAQLQDLRNYDLTQGDLANGNNGTLIQLPWIQLQRARGTITVPDRGSLLLGGLKRVDDRDMSAGVPLLSKIPLFGMLWGRKAKSISKQVLLIMVQPTIVELDEIEQKID
jgi:tetratricopeptide (TPR) repeat protein